MYARLIMVAVHVIACIFHLDSTYYLSRWEFAKSHWFITWDWTLQIWLIYEIIIIIMHLEMLFLYIVQLYHSVYKNKVKKYRSIMLIKLQFMIGEKDMYISWIGRIYKCEIFLAECFFMMNLNQFGLAILHEISHIQNKISHGEN